MSLGVVGRADASFAGRAWVRRFPHGDVELLYRSSGAPSELEQLNAWLEDAGIENRVTRLAPPGYGRQAPSAERQASAESNAERSVRRAKQRVRWSAKAIGCAPSDSNSIRTREQARRS